jgi:hypothetical protein
LARCFFCRFPSEASFVQSVQLACRAYDFQIIKSSRYVGLECDTALGEGVVVAFQANRPYFSHPSIPSNGRFDDNVFFIFDRDRFRIQLLLARDTKSNFVLNTQKNGFTLIDTDKVVAPIVPLSDCNSYSALAFF